MHRPTIGEAPNVVVPIICAQLDDKIPTHHQREVSFLRTSSTHRELVATRAKLCFKTRRVRHQTWLSWLNSRSYHVDLVNLELAELDQVCTTRSRRVQFSSSRNWVSLVVLRCGNFIKIPKLTTYNNQLLQNLSNGTVDAWIKRSNKSSKTQPNFIKKCQRLYFLWVCETWYTVQYNQCFRSTPCPWH